MMLDRCLTQATRSHIRDCLLYRGFSVHLADFRWEVRQPWQKKWYSVMNYGTLAPQFVNDNPGSELGPEPCLSSSSSSARWCGPRSSRGCTRGRQRLPCTLSHYHASWCVGLNVCHQASKALSPTDLTHASSAFGSNMIIVSWIKRRESLWACYVGYVTVCLVGLSNSFSVFVEYLQCSEWQIRW